MAALVHVSQSPESAGASRYRYVAAFFLLLAVAGLARRLWRSTRLNGRTVLPVAVLLIVALGSNVFQLLSWRDFFQERATETRADLQLVSELAGTGAVPAATARNGMAFLGNIPPPAVLQAILADYGSPLDDPLTNSVPVPDETTQSVLFHLVEPDLQVSALAGAPQGLAPVQVVSMTGVQTSEDGPCVVATPVASDPQVTLLGPGGSSLVIQGPAGGEVQLFLSQSSNYYESASIRFPLAATGITAISLPDIRSDRVWYLRLDPPPVPVRLCQAT
jgi:hypothetical protein